MRHLVLLLAFTAWAQEDSFAPVERLLADGRYQPALEALQRSSARGARWHLLASRAYDGLDDAARAVAEAEAALSLEPANEAAHLQLGQIFLSHNTPAAAYEVFRDARKLLPQSFLIRMGTGLALKELQRYDEAAQELEKCLAEQPSSAIAFDALATVYLNSLDGERLVQISETYVSRNPSDYRGYYYVAAARERLGNSDDVTCRLLRESIEKNPKFAAAFGLLGKVMLRRGALQEAQQNLERAVALRPDHVPSRLALANTYRKLGRDSDAARQFRIVRELLEKERQPRPALSYHRGNITQR